MKTACACVCVCQSNTLSHTHAATLLACGLDRTNAESPRLRGPQHHAQSGSGDGEVIKPAHGRVGGHYSWLHSFRL